MSSRCKRIAPRLCNLHGSRLASSVMSEEVPCQHRTLHTSNIRSDDCGSMPDKIGNLKLSRYIFNLSLPPKRRYQHIAANLRTQAAALPTTFDQLVKDFAPGIPKIRVRKLAKLLL